MLTVLVADDDPDMRTLTCEMLRRAGYRPLQAETGAQALAQMHAADLLLCDLFMPDTDGIEVLQAARERPDAPPIITMSGGYGEIDMLPAAAQLGAADALAKPFTSQALLAAVARAVPATGSPHTNASTAS